MLLDDLEALISYLGNPQLFDHNTKKMTEFFIAELQMNDSCFNPDWNLDPDPSDLMVSNATSTSESESEDQSFIDLLKKPEGQPLLHSLVGHLFNPAHDKKRQPLFYFFCESCVGKQILLQLFSLENFNTILTSLGIELSEHLWISYGEGGYRKSALDYLYESTPGPLVLTQMTVMRPDLAERIQEYRQASRSILKASQRRKQVTWNDSQLTDTFVFPEPDWESVVFSFNTVTPDNTSELIERCAHDPQWLSTMYALMNPPEEDSELTASLQDAQTSDNTESSASDNPASTSSESLSEQPKQSPRFLTIEALCGELPLPLFRDHPATFSPLPTLCLTKAGAQFVGRLMTDWPDLAVEMMTHASPQVLNQTVHTLLQSQEGAHTLLIILHRLSQPEQYALLKTLILAIQKINTSVQPLHPNNAEPILCSTEFGLDLLEQAHNMLVATCLYEGQSNFFKTFQQFLLRCSTTPYSTLFHSIRGTVFTLKAAWPILSSEHPRYAADFCRDTVRKLTKTLVTVCHTTSVSSLFYIAQDPTSSVCLEEHYLRYLIDSTYWEGDAAQQERAVILQTLWNELSFYMPSMPQSFLLFQLSKHVPGIHILSQLLQEPACLRAIQKNKNLLTPIATPRPTSVFLQLCYHDNGINLLVPIFESLEVIQAHRESIKRLLTSSSKVIRSMTFREFLLSSAQGCSTLLALFKQDSQLATAIELPSSARSHTALAFTPPEIDEQFRPRSQSVYRHPGSTVRHRRQPTMTTPGDLFSGPPV